MNDKPEVINRDQEAISPKRLVCALVLFWGDKDYIRLF